MIHLSDIDAKRPATEGEVAHIRNDDWKDAVDVAELRVHDGDLTLDDDFTVSGASLMVLGDLTVAGTVGVDETGTLVVTGRLRCRNLACEGNLEIGGDADVGEAIFGYYEAGISFFLAAVRAALLVQGNHAFEFDHDRLTVGTHLRFDNFHSMSKGTVEQARQVLSDEAFAALAGLLGVVKHAPPTEGARKLLFSDGFLRR
jgi:hypothetical protein